MESNQYVIDKQPLPQPYPFPAPTVFGEFLSNHQQLDFLRTANYFKVKREYAGCCDCSAIVTYAFSDEVKAPLFKAVQDNSQPTNECCTCYPDINPFMILDSQDRPIGQIDYANKNDSKGCCSPGSYEIKVSSPPGNHIGSIVTNYANSFFGYRTFEIRNASSQVMMTIIPKTNCCSSTEYPILVNGNLVANAFHKTQSTDVAISAEFEPSIKLVLAAFNLWLHQIEEERRRQNKFTAFGILYLIIS